MGLILVVCAAVPAYGVEQAMSVGYGIAAFNPGLHFGRIEGGRNYDFFQVTYLVERPCTDHLPLAVFIEPFASYVNRPNSGVDFGFFTGLKYCLQGADKKGFYFTGGTGMVYSTIGFKEQGTHLDFTLEAGVGYRYGRFFIENRLRHYSNGAWPRQTGRSTQTSSASAFTSEIPHGSLKAGTRQGRERPA